MVLWQGPTSRSGLAETRGTRAPGRFVAATSSGLIPGHRYQAAGKWIHRHQGEHGQSGPPGLFGAQTGALPRPGRRIAQEAFEAYGKSFLLPALPHLPFPPGYVPPPVSMGTGGSRHGTLSTLQRRDDYRQGATAAEDPGVRSLYHGEGQEGPKEKTSPPPTTAKCLTSCLRRACIVPATCVLRREDNEGAPPPHTLPPP